MELVIGAILTSGFTLAITVNDVTVDVMAAFLGFCLLILANKKLMGSSYYLPKMQKICRVMFFVAVILYAYTTVMWTDRFIPKLSSTFSIVAYASIGYLLRGILVVGVLLYYYNLQKVFGEYQLDQQLFLTKKVSALQILQGLVWALDLLNLPNTIMGVLGKIPEPFTYPKVFRKPPFTMTLFAAELTKYLIPAVRFALAIATAVVFFQIRNAFLTGSVRKAGEDPSARRYFPGETKKDPPQLED